MKYEGRMFLPNMFSAMQKISDIFLKDGVKESIIF